MDDLISRQAVLEATSTTLKITGKENAETVYAYIKKLCDDIKALPSAQRKGRWEYNEKESHLVKCSECKHLFNAEWNFCPNCGADMRGENNET